MYVWWVKLWLILCICIAITAIATLHYSQLSYLQTPICDLQESHYSWLVVIIGSVLVMYVSMLYIKLLYTNR